ncbi:hypothetical protein [Bdellovibrio sp. HCB337]|uniref:hypothetical protein n=1 Tax=Bdellovibrio sp. HCB337 TaxID=3394358 RepID=UPI0039A48EA5
MLSKAWILPTLMLTTLSIFPISMGKLKFVPIYKTLTIKANKKLPPHIAFMDSHFENQDDEWTAFEKKNKSPLAVGFSVTSQQGPYVLTQKKVLEGFVIRKSAEVLSLASQGVYKTKAQAVAEVQGPQWLKNIVGDSQTLPRAEEPVHNLLAARRVMGPLEITGGLAVTNEHHIEIRRSDEGVFREMGRVDLMKGSYSIDIDDASGAIVARLLDRSGTILGEGSIRLSQLQVGQGRLIYGPRLEVAPSPSWKGRVSRYYGDPKKDKTGGTTKVTSFGGENTITVGSNGEISLDISKGSTTIVRAEAAEHVPSSKIMLAGDAKTFGVTLFPNSTMEALKSLAAEQKSLSRSHLDETSFVWGTVSLDGKPLSGVSVVSETDPETKAIYFNEFMIPDPKLTATSGSGLYAFVDLHDGFHALLAQRGFEYFGHQNVEVERGSVAIGDLESTLRTEPVHVRAFDAFSGEPVSLVANMQSLSEPVDINEGSASIILPQISRMSMIYTETPPEYINANYFYNDQDSYIHLPMLSHAWLTEMKRTAKINEMPDTGTIVGFFNEESFEVYLAAQAQNSPAYILYFDAAGRVIEGNRGQAGGGFIIFNVPYGTQETVVVGSTSEKVFSKVVPVDMESISVLSFSSY